MWRATVLFVVTALASHSSFDAWDDGTCQDRQGQVPSSSVMQRSANVAQENFDQPRNATQRQLSPRNSSSRTQTGQQPEELPWWKKLAFVCASVVYLVVTSYIMTMMIDNYEANASPTTPPWYVDAHTVFKISGYILISWLGLGHVAFNQVLLFNDPPQHLTFAESMYLCVQIVTTVGYGDITPANPVGTLFVAFYVMVGVTLVAIAVATFMDLVATPLSDVNTTCHGHLHLPSHSPSLDDDDDDEGEALAYSPSQSGGVHVHGARQAGIGTSTTKTPHTHVVTRSIVYFSALVIVGTLFFHFCPGEEKSFLNAFYMSCITLTTVGFGAFHPVTQFGYAFAAIWMLIGVAYSAYMIQVITQWFLQHRKELTSALMDAELLKLMDSDGNRKVDKAEFIVFQLLRDGLVEQRVIDNVFEDFRKLDVDGSGYLEVEFLKMASQKAIRSRDSEVRNANLHSLFQERNVNRSDVGPVRSIPSRHCEIS